MRKILMPIPDSDFDPTETAVPWKILTEAGFEIHFATPNGAVGKGDERMVTGQGLGMWSASLKAAPIAVSAYKAMAKSSEFLHPISYKQIKFAQFSGIILPGGHAPGMKAYLESSILQNVAAEFILAGKPVGAICHGVVLASRSKNPDGSSVLFKRNVTALPAWMELAAWAMTGLWLGRYYRTYSQTVQSEVTSALESGKQFKLGPMSTKRDDESKTKLGFIVRDRNLLTARWPGDAHRFAYEYKNMMNESST